MAKGLGRIFDLGTGFAPVDLNTADGATGLRLSMADCTGVTIVFIGAVGGSEDLTLDVQQATAYTGGTSGDLDSATTGATGITEYWIKAETALDNDEAWVKVTQAEASEVVVVGATYGAKQKIVAFYIGADQLSDTYTHISVNAACSTSTAQLGTLLYLKHDLHVQRVPSNLPNLLNPGAANA